MVVDHERQRADRTVDVLEQPDMADVAGGHGDVVLNLERDVRRLQQRDPAGRSVVKRFQFDSSGRSSGSARREVLAVVLLSGVERVGDPRIAVDHRRSSSLEIGVPGIGRLTSGLMNSRST